MTGTIPRAAFATALLSLVGQALFAQSSIIATGIIETTAGGFKFPDGTVQTTSATAPMTVRFSILAEAMRPVDSTIGFDCADANLKTISDSSLAVSAYVGQINLPDGSVIQDATCYGFDTAPQDLLMAVLRYRFNGDSENSFTQVTETRTSSGVTGLAEITSPAIDPPPPDKPGLAIINNEDFSYGLYLGLPAASSGKLYVVRCLVRSTPG